MKFKTPSGKVKTLKNAKKYLINWGGKSRSLLQERVKAFLFPYWSRHIVFEEFRVLGTRLTLDIYNANELVAVEIQGKQHLQYNKFFHRGNRANFRSQLKRDDDKLSFCQENGITLVEVYEGEEVTKELFKKQGVIL